MTRIETTEDFERARERLRGRNSDSLVAFLMSLAMDSGPVGEQVRTFIVGDNIAETVASVRRRISGLGIPSAYEHRHSLGEVACAYKRAVGVMAEAAKHLPRAEIEERVKGLIEGDAYGVRAGLVSVYEAQAR